MAVVLIIVNATYLFIYNSGSWSWI